MLHNIYILKTRIEFYLTLSQFHLSAHPTKPLVVSPRAGHAGINCKGVGTIY